MRKREFRVIKLCSSDRNSNCCGVILKKWEPPIKKQYVALSLLAIGLILGHLMVNYAAYGFLMAGLVFYKDELVEEVKLVKESVIAVKKEKDLTNGEDK